MATIHVQVSTVAAAVTFSRFTGLDICRRTLSKITSYYSMLLSPVVFRRRLGTMEIEKAYSYGTPSITKRLMKYQEILTDPSYAGQFVLMTNPHIGNSGPDCCVLFSNGPGDPSAVPYAGVKLRSLGFAWVTNCSETH
ncbi:Carbamoyl-phosphate synthase small chain, chloroplastic [Linum grandiflorum]